MASKANTEAQLQDNEMQNQRLHVSAHLGRCRPGAPRIFARMVAGFDKNNYYR